jgi:hypothetical protein
MDRASLVPDSEWRTARDAFNFSEKKWSDRSLFLNGLNCFNRNTAKVLYTRPLRPQASFTAP